MNFVEEMAAVLFVSESSGPESNLMAFWSGEKWKPDRMRTGGPLAALQHVDELELELDDHPGHFLRFEKMNFVEEMAGHNNTSITRSSIQKISWEVGKKRTVACTASMGPSSSVTRSASTLELDHQRAKFHESEK